MDVSLGTSLYSFFSYIWTARFERVFQRLILFFCSLPTYLRCHKHIHIVTRPLVLCLWIMIVGMSSQRDKANHTLEWLQITAHKSDWNHINYLTKHKLSILYMQFSQIRLRKRLQVFQYFILISNFTFSGGHYNSLICSNCAFQVLTISIWFDFMETEEEEKISW